MKTKCEDIELLLTAVGAIQRSQVPGAPTHVGSQKPDTIDEEDEEEEEAERRDRGVFVTQGDRRRRRSWMMSWIGTRGSL